MMKSIALSAGCLIFALVCSCSKKDKDGPEGGAPALPGSLLYDFAGEIYKMDLATGTRSVYFSYNSYSFIGWDLSVDGQYGLTSEREPGNYTATKFKLLKVSDGQIAKEFDYTPPNGNKQDYSGLLSPDNSLIMMQPDYENGVVIVNTDGQIQHHLQGINGEKLGLGDEVIWLPDNSILLTFQGRYILKASPPYTDLTLVKQMDYDQWGNINTNREGTKISLQIGLHIYVMDIDGNNLIQVTDSESGENMAIFSPDGQHLLVGADYIHAPVSGRSVWKLKIVPNDGKMHHLDNDPAVILVKPSNETIEASVSGRSLWIE